LFEALAIHAPNPLILTFSPNGEKGFPLLRGEG
jgi:hypothetical protein